MRESQTEERRGKKEESEEEREMRMERGVHLASSDSLPAGVSDLIPYHLHPVLSVHGQMSSINPRHITWNLDTHTDRQTDRDRQKDTE